MPTRTLVLALSVLAVLPALGGCKSAAEKLEETLKSEMPADCSAYCGTASCGGECRSAASLEKAKEVVKSHCAEIKEIGTTARLQEVGKMETNRYFDSTTCEFKETP